MELVTVHAETYPAESVSDAAEHAIEMVGVMSISRTLSMKAPTGPPGAVAAKRTGVDAAEATNCIVCAFHQLAGKASAVLMPVGTLNPVGAPLIST